MRVSASARSITARVRDGDGRDKRWVKQWNCKIYTTYRKGIMSITAASDGSWTLIHIAQATYMTTPTVIMHMYICPAAVVPGVALPSTEDYLCCNIALYFIL